MHHNRFYQPTSRTPYLIVYCCALIIMVAGVAATLRPTPVATASGSCSPTAIENQNPGTDAWIISNPANDIDHQIKGYASANSVNVGDDIAFHVSVTPAQNYEIDIFRMGWYAGLGGRLMHQSGSISGSVQPGLVISPTIGLIEAPWSADYTLTVPTNWVSGVYMAKLTNAAGFENYVPFVVREDNRVADLLYSRPDMTDQAYNNYPNDNVTGKSLYANNSHGGNTIAGESRAVKISFDRPYADDGSGLFFNWEFNLIRWLEQRGYDVAYSANLDTHLNAANLTNFAGFLSPGHDEYWSFEMRTGIDAARDAGTNLAFFGANTSYVPARMEDSTAAASAASGNPIQPNRTLVSYKNWNLDPITNNQLKTALWRNIWLGGYHAEQKLVGVQYESYGHFANNTDYIVTNSNHWIYANTGLSNGDTIPRIIGYEVDNLDPSFAPPVNQSYTMLSNSPYVDAFGNTVTANSAIYQAPSGAWVFGSGTMSWSWALDRADYVDDRVKQMTANLLDTFIGSAPMACNHLPTPTPTVPPPAATATPIPVAAPVNGFAYTAYSAGVYANTDTDAALAALIPIGANWVSILPTWYQPNIDSTEMYYDYGITPTDADIIHAINDAHALGLKVLLKPHIDLRSDPSHWRGQIGTNFSAAEREIWFANYRNFINRYAVLAEAHNVEMFAVGTELVQTTTHTAEWRGVIGDVRNRYSGPITYAANHSGDELQVAFWEDVDLIGIDAYYPLTTDSAPSLSELEAGWSGAAGIMSGLNATHQKPVLLTEVGYTSSNGANTDPWCTGCFNVPDLQEQADAYQSVYNVFAAEPWFLGTIWWEWEIDSVSGSPCDTRYTPYSKPAENVIRTNFGAPTRTIGIPCPPADLVQQSLPSGTISQSDPAFVWQPVGNATDYRVVIYDVSNMAVYDDAIFSAAAICGVTACTATFLNLLLPPGAYTWLVLPQNGYGDGTWSSAP